MDFVSQHFTRHHFFHAPHRWFLSLLLSPIHLAEKHYQKRYHLQYRHAKKLFFFDISLLATVLVLISSIIFWLNYDPSVTALVYLDIFPRRVDEAQQVERIPSGAYTEYLVSYANKSNTELKDPDLSLQLPSGFILDSVKPADQFSSSTRTFDLPDLKPGAEGELSFGGWFYGAVDQESPISARISYTQAGKKEIETKTAHMIATLRGSTVEIKINGPTYIISQGTHELSINIINRGTREISLLRVPLVFPDGFEMRTATGTVGSIENATWTIKNMGINQEAELHLSLSSNISQDLTKQELSFTPEVIIDSQKFPQTKLTHIYTIVHPNLETSAVWDKAQIKPGETNALKIILKNTGDVELKNLVLSIPLSPDTLDLNMLAKINHGILNKNTFKIDSGYNAGFSSLNPQEEIEINLDIPLSKVSKNGTDLVLKLIPVLSADISADGSSYRFERSFETPAVSIGTLLSLNAEARYFTNEGDQLGRGPLPPLVGEETKYWILINISNTSSEVRDLSFSAKIPSYVRWTGRSSVSKGQNLLFEGTSRLVSWSIASLDPYENIGLYMELGLTPTQSQKGSSPVLLTDTTLNGTDDFISSLMSLSIPSVDSSLQADKKSQTKGVVVQ